MVMMLGGNGAGKTTTINTFLDFIQPTRGEALINGINANQEPLKAKKFVAFVSENVQLYPNFSAIQNVHFLFDQAVKLITQEQIMKTPQNELDFREMLLTKS